MRIFTQLISLVAQMVKCLPTMRETWIRSLGREDPLEKEMATHSTTLAWKIPWMEEPGRLQSMGSQKVGHDWANSLHFTFYFYQKKKKKAVWDFYCDCTDPIDQFELMWNFNSRWFSDSWTRDFSCQGSKGMCIRLGKLFSLHISYWICSIATSENSLFFCSVWYAVNSIQ